MHLNHGFSTWSKTGKKNYEAASTIKFQSKNFRAFYDFNKLCFIALEPW